LLGSTGLPHDFRPGEQVERTTMSTGDVDGEQSAPIGKRAGEVVRSRAQRAPGLSEVAQQRPDRIVHSACAHVLSQRRLAGSAEAVGQGGQRHPTGDRLRVAFAGFLRRAEGNKGD
jgi:hypothetical protein